MDKIDIKNKNYIKGYIQGFSAGFASSASIETKKRVERILSSEGEYLLDKNQNRDITEIMEEVVKSLLPLLT